MSFKTTPVSASIAKGVLAQMAEMEHEQVLFCQDKETGLKAIIAVHNTVLGPALGGTRMWNYATEEEALNDVLRLSRGMTFKAAITGLKLGGGKAVIIGDAKTQKNEALMRRFGKFVETLGGKYITAEDVGMETQDMVYIKKETDHVTGLPVEMGGNGNPSPVTAYGVYRGMKAAAKFTWGTDSLAGKKVLVQGTGHVGETLIDYLTKEGATVFVNDINPERVKTIVANYNAIAVSGNIYAEEVDIYAPCALGATLNSETIPQLRCAIVCGAANNQLLDEKVHGQMLKDRGIVYAPDFLINAGGIITVYAEVAGYNMQKTMEETARIYDTTLNILNTAKEQNITTAQAALNAAMARIAAARKN
ncbi:MAG: Glu/Leu/Phe/Val dehydrogenase dimerization domain-containing protein [Bacteroidia bacterium]